MLRDDYGIFEWEDRGVFPIDWKGLLFTRWHYPVTCKMKFWLDLMRGVISPRHFWKELADARRDGGIDY